MNSHSKCLITNILHLQIYYITNNIYIDLLSCFDLFVYSIIELTLWWNFFTWRVTNTSQTTKTINPTLSSRSSESFGEKSLSFTCCDHDLQWMDIIISEYMMPMLNGSKLHLVSSIKNNVKNKINVKIDSKCCLLDWQIHIYWSLSFVLNLFSFIVIMLINYSNSPLPAIWIFSILFGVGTSSLYPTICSFMETFVSKDLSSLMPAG